MALYWITTLLFTALGIFLLWGMFFKIVPDSFERYQASKEYAKKYPKKAKLRKEQRKNKEKICNVLSYLLVTVIFVGIPCYIFSIITPNLLDFPRAITGNYKEITGVVTGKDVANFEGKSWGYPFYTYIDGVFYSSTIVIDANIGETITVKALPNTKVIVDKK